MEAKADRFDLPIDGSQLKITTLGKLVDRYLAEVTPTKKSAEAETYVLQAFKKHPITRKSLHSLTTNDFAKYRDTRLEQIRPSSLRRELNSIQHMFEVARDEWGIPIKENPLAKLKLKAADNRRERRLREGELELLLEAGKYLRNRYVVPVILFALETAMATVRSPYDAWG